jgi:hypothetical protein
MIVRLDFMSPCFFVCDGGFREFAQSLAQLNRWKASSVGWVFRNRLSTSPKQRLRTIHRQLPQKRRTAGQRVQTVFLLGTQNLVQREARLLRARAADLEVGERVGRVRL